MALIEVEGLRHSCRFGGGLVWALDGVSLSIRQGEFVAVVGPSGSGKSTFMHILGCLDRPTEGKYRLDGRSVKELPHDALARTDSNGQHHDDRRNSDDDAQHGERAANAVSAH